MTTYLAMGGFGLCQVFTQRCPRGAYRPLARRLDLYPHDGPFEWGGVGPGATRLALAILADHLGPGRDREALALAEGFAAGTIARLRGGCWTLETDDVEEAIALLREDPVGFGPEAA